MNILGLISQLIGIKTLRLIDVNALNLQKLGTIQLLLVSSFICRNVLIATW